MIEGELVVDQNIGYNKANLIKQIKESWGIEVWDIKEEYIETFDKYWSRIVIFRFPDKLNFEEMFQFNSLDIDKKKFFKILQKLDPNLFMTVNQIVIINNKEEYVDLIVSYIIIYMEAIKKVVKEECEIWPYSSERAELNRAFWQTLLHELRHSMQENPLFENEFETMNREEKEREAEDYCRRVFQDIIIQNDYYVIR
ncbi:MAG: hypothetical protein PWQ37_2803 [Candidatus Petromonas sp.]|nr:hypothetical protein [Petrotoga sp.]MDK2920070.1 hypothetical protein [Candidatus Petromonas sp.]